MATRAALVAGLGLLVAAVCVVLAQSAPREAGSNFVPEIGEAVKFKRGGGRHCQDGETIARGAAALRLRIGTYGRPVPEVRVRATSPGGAEVIAGERPSGGEEGQIVVPVERGGDGLSRARVCLRVGGPGRSVLYGTANRVRFEWMRSGSESWFELLPTIAHRFGLARANPAGSWLLPIAGLVLLVAWVSAIRLVLREMAS